MKKALIIFFGILMLILGSAIAIPFLFKDKIIEKVQAELDQSLNAKVFLDPDQLSVSIFSDFPRLSARLGNFGVVGIDEFASDTLVQAEEVELAFNLASILFEEKPSLEAFYLKGGDLYVKVLENGKANYDIVKESEGATSTSESNFSLGIDQIEIIDSRMIYEDQTFPLVLALGDLNAKGRGDFTLEVYDLPIEATATIADFNYDGIHYLTNKKFKGETLLQVDLNQMKFTLQEGQFALNDFLFDLNGFIALPEEGVDLDLEFDTPETDFKNLLSLVPGIYQENFASIQTSGTMKFSGLVKGMYSDSSFPSFDFNLEVGEGKFQYPDLPLPVENINLKFQAKNQSNDLNSTQLAIPVFSLKLGSNPISGEFFLSNLTDYTMEGKLNGKLNLKELTAVFPIPDTQLSGLLEVNAQAKGRYEESSKTLPAMEAQVKLQNGFVQNTGYPVPLENLTAQATIQSPNGRMEDFNLLVEAFGFELEGEKITGRFTLQDFEKLNWDAALQGSVDLKKLTTIFPIEGTQLAGKIQADLKTIGSYAELEANRYDRIQASGLLNVAQLTYLSEEYPQGVRINEAKFNFNPQRATLENFDGVLGRSPLNASGYLSNYLDYLLSENGILKGQLSLESSRFDVNEWLTASDSSAEDSPIEVIPLPENLDFSMTIAADEVLYDNLSLKAVTGNMNLKNGVLTFSETGMNLLDGRVQMRGSYDPRDLAQPKFDFNLDLAQLSIPKAFQSLNTVKAFAPIAGNLSGLVNSTISFSGLLGPDMAPILSSINVDGLLKVAETALKDSKILAGVTSLTGLKDGNTLQLRNLAIPIHIQNGRLEVKPFDLKLWDYEANIQGSGGFDGSMNYLLQMQVPAGKFGAKANSILATISETEANQSTQIPIALKIGGSYNQPKISLAGENSIETLLTNALKSRLDSEKENLQAKATQEFQAAQDSLKQELKTKADVLQDSLKKELEKKTGKATEKAVDEAKTLLKGLLTKPKTKPDSIPTPK